MPAETEENDKRIVTRSLAEEPKELDALVEEFSLKEKKASDGESLSEKLRKFVEGEYVQCKFCRTFSRIGDKEGSQYCGSCAAPLPDPTPAEAREIAEGLMELDKFVRRDEDYWANAFLLDTREGETTEDSCRRMMGLLVISRGREDELLRGAREIMGEEQWWIEAIKIKVLGELTDEARKDYVSLLFGDKETQKQIGVWKMKAKRGRSIDVNDEGLLDLAAGIAVDRGWEAGGDWNMVLADELGERVGAVEGKMGEQGEKDGNSAIEKMFKVEELPNDKEKLITLFRERMLSTLNMATDKVKAETVAMEIGLVIPEASRRFASKFPEAHLDLQEKLLAELRARVNIQNCYFDRLTVANDYGTRIDRMKGGGWSNIDYDDYVTIAKLGELNGESKKLLGMVERAIKTYVDCGEKRREDLINDLGRDRFSKNYNDVGEVIDSNFFSISSPSKGLIADIRAKVREEIGGGILADDAENLAWQFMQASDVVDYFNREGNYSFHLNRLTAFGEWREFQARFRGKQVGLMRLLVKSDLDPDDKTIKGVFVGELPRLARPSWDYVKLERGSDEVSGLGLAREGHFFTGMNWRKLNNSPSVMADEGIVMGSIVLEFIEKLKELTPRDFTNPDFFSGINGKLFALSSKRVLSIEEVLNAKTEIARDIFWEFSVKNPLMSKIKDDRGVDRWVQPKMMEDMHNAIMSSINPAAGSYFDQRTPDGLANFNKFEKGYQFLLGETKKRETKKQVMGSLLDVLGGIIKGL
ncbi:hypothetical protein KKG65_01020 [Patescibacteria group bacterium]|nr:hypothetical protein [Patescibacteria group bacterium]